MSKTSILIILGLLVLTFLLALPVETDRMNSIINNIVFGSVSIFVGILVAIVGIFLGSINSIYLSIYKHINSDDSELSDEDINDIQLGIKELVDELKQNTLFSLFSFLTIIVLIISKDISISNVQWFVNEGFYTKEFAINHLILFVSSLVFYAIIDSTLTIFKITDAFRIEKE